VAKITQERVTPFKNGILGWGWLRCFRRRNLDLFLKITHGFKVGCAKGLCPNIERKLQLGQCDDGFQGVSKEFDESKWERLALKVWTQIIRYGLPKCPFISVYPFRLWKCMFNWRMNGKFG
jgi:hypothetical protein